MKTQQKFALGLLGGVLIGATAGLLLAPRNGKENRQALASWARNLADWVKQYRDHRAGSPQESFNHQVGASA